MCGSRNPDGQSASPGDCEFGCEIASKIANRNALTCTAPFVLNDSGDACYCAAPLVLNSTGDGCEAVATAANTYQWT